MIDVGAVVELRGIAPQGAFVEQLELGLRRASPRADHDDLAQVRQLQPVEALDETVVRDHHACLGGVDDVGEHVAAISRVERHEHGAEVIGCKPGEHHRAPGRQPGDDAVAFPDAEPLQAGRRGTDLRQAFAVGPGAAVFEQGEATLRMACRARVQHRLEDAVFPCRDRGIQPGWPTLFEPHAGTQLPEATFAGREPSSGSSSCFNTVCRSK